MCSAALELNELFLYTCSGHSCRYGGQSQASLTSLKYHLQRHGSYQCTNRNMSFTLHCDGCLSNYFSIVHKTECYEYLKFLASLQVYLLLSVWKQISFALKQSLSSINNKSSEDPSSSNSNKWPSFWSSCTLIVHTAFILFKEQFSRIPVHLVNYE